MILQKKNERVAFAMVGGCSKDSVFFLELFVGVVQTFRQSFRTNVSQIVFTGQLLTVWMILKSENDQRTTHFALTSPSHHQSGLGVVVSTFSKAEQWVVFSSSFLPARLIVDESCTLLSACT